MKKVILAALMALISTPVVPAFAQSNDGYRQDSRASDRQIRQSDRRANRNQRAATRDWRQYRNYDHDRFETGSNSYDAERYYRDDRSYRSRRLSSNDRVYRGQNNQYYCRRSDGTTGLIAGGVGGALLGNTIAPGGSELLGTLIGAGGGALAGRAVERSVSCR